MSLQPGLFDSAVIPFFRTVTESDLTNHLRDLLHQNERYSNNHIEWRDNIVTDAYGRRIPAGAERLMHWDTRHPDVVFERGIEPRIAPPNESDLDSNNANLGSYINGNADSIFVSAVRSYRNPDGHVSRWAPCNFAGRFEYEIFAHGGVDINESLGSNNRRHEEHRIVFPGGIRREYIRSARQFDASGRATAIWLNSYFDVPANSDVARLHLYHLPDPLCGSSIDVHYWMGPPEDRPPQSRRSYYAYEFGDDNRTCKNKKGFVATPDPLSESCLVPHPTRASFLDPAHPNTAYFFADTQYASINVMPGTTDDKLLSGPGIIARGWAALRAARFGQVDAVLPTNRGNEVYFFARDKYALIDVTDGPGGSKLINGPKKIATEWPSLKQAGCKTVDAVLPHPEADDKAYFFCGSQYTIVQYKVGTTEDVIVQTPRKTVENWPSLAKAGFDRIDSALPNPNNKAEAYFFSGTRYMLVKVKPETTDDAIVNGPKWVRKEWPSLKSAAFYGEDLYSWTPSS